MSQYSSSIAWSPGDSAFVAVSPEFPGLSGFGATPSEALDQLQIAIDLALETIKEDGQTPPAPAILGEFSGQFRLRIPKTLHRALSERAEAEGTSLNALASVFLSECVGRSETQLRCAKQYQDVLDRSHLAVSQLLAAMVQFNSAASTVFEGDLQDPGLRLLYGDASIQPTKH
jgi:predicted RNase H-like HicB family nuclease